MDLTQTLVDEICNPAIRSIGAKKIPTPTTDMTEVTLCQDLYKTVRDSELRERVWACTKKRAAVTKEATDPDHYDWAYQYAFPSDCALLLSMEHNYLFAVESGFFYTNVTDGSDQIRVKYVQFADTTSGTAVDAEIARFDFGLKNVLISRLAIALTPTLAPRKKQEAEFNYEKALNTAMISNCFEDLKDILDRTIDDPPCITERWGD